MKIFALLLSLAVANSTLVLADECTLDELTAISNMYSSAAAKSCSDMTMTMRSADVCTYADCVKVMSTMLEDLPDCSTSGINIKESVQAAVDFCKTGTADMSGVFTDSSLDSSTASSDSALQTLGPSTNDKANSDTNPPATDTSSASSLGLVACSTAFAATVLFGAL